MLLSILFILLIIFGIGLPLVLLIAPKANFSLKLGLSFPVGIGVFTLLMFGTNLIGLKFTLLNELLLLLGVSIPLVLSQLKKFKILFTHARKEIKETKLDLAEKIILVTSLFLVITSFINTFYWPVYMWDSVVLYDFRGHVFAVTGFMKDAFINGYYYSYPLLTSLSHAIVYLCGGKYPQFIYSIFYLSLGVSIYGLLREFVSKKLSLFATMLLLMTGPLFYHSLYSYTNLTYTVYLSLGAILIYLWDRKKDIGYLILSALLTGISVWIRSNEPFWLAALFVVVIVSIYRRKIWDILVFSLFFFPIREIWKMFQGSLIGSGGTTVSEIAGYARAAPSLINFEKWGQVIIYLYKYVVTPWGAIFAAFILASVFIFTKRRTYTFLMFFIVFVLMGVLIVGTIQFSVITDYWYRIGDAAQRLSMLFYPLFIYCIVIVLQDIVKIGE